MGDDLRPLQRVTDSEALRSLVEAGSLLARELSLDRILQQIVDIAREIVGARYAALGVAEEGRIGDFVYSGLDQSTRDRIGELPQGRGVLGLLLKERKPLRLRDISEHPASVGFPSHHPRMTSFLGVPVVARGEVFGRLYLTDKEGAGGFSEEDEAVAMTLATQAGIAIDNARLVEAERRAAAQRAQLELERDRARLRREILRRVIAAQEDERRRVARELHDETGQALTSVILGLGLLERSEDIESTREQASRLRGQLMTALHELRRLAVQLRPTVLDDLGLVPAVRRLIDDSPLREQVAVRFDHGGIDGRLDPSAETVLYRCIQEALTNVTRHAHASKVDIRLTEGEGEITAVVQDDGRGFDPKATGPGVGLEGMRERVSLVGGSLEIDSAPGEGTRIRVSVPLRPEAAESE